MERVARTLDRIVPGPFDRREELIANVFISRTRPLAGPVYVKEGFGGSDEEVVVLIPLEKWDAGNGLFCAAQVSLGQDICLGGSEPITFPGTGGCLMIVFFMRLPRA